jgi:hypothetical protein
LVVAQYLDRESTTDLSWLVGTYPSRRFPIQLRHDRFNVSNLACSVHVNAFCLMLKTWLANPATACSGFAKLTSVNVSGALATGAEFSLHAAPLRG